MAQVRLNTRIGAISLRTPLIAASGTVGSVWEWAEIADVSCYGAAVAKSVSPQPWEGRPPPRLAPTATGMLNGIGIQNPGIETWCDEVAPRFAGLDLPIWGSAVAEAASGFGIVAKGLASSGAAAIEVNLSCPNLDNGVMFSFDPAASAQAVAAVATAADVPVGAKLSPNTPDLLAVAVACLEAGASFLVLTNTALGFGVDLAGRRPSLSGGVGGYSGPGLKPVSLRCVYEIARALPDVPIIGCGGIATGEDVVEYLLAGASAVELGTVHLAEPRAGARIARELARWMQRRGIASVSQLVGSIGEA